MLCHFVLGLDGYLPLSSPVDSTDTVERSKAQGRSCQDAELWSDEYGMCSLSCLSGLQVSFCWNSDNYSS